jgi:hypothetical protein
VAETIICAQKERLTGLGDLACWYDSSHNELQVVKGATFLDIHLLLGAGNTTEPITALARKLVDRLR